ncbi:hypothetical protein AAG906_034853 [Vitis piasezkii]
MEKKLSSAAKTLTPSPIQELSHLAQRCNSINLAEVSPTSQCRTLHVQGICDYLARKMKEMHGLDVDPLTDIAICCGQSEAFAAAVFALIDPGDEVILFDPSYETYGGCITMAGGIPVCVDLDPPHWTLGPNKLMKSFTVKTKAIILNSPHNPTGKVFTKDELEIISGACLTKDCLAITDEVYEYITFYKEKHVTLVSLPGMQKRTIITSSLSKTFVLMFCWRVGWAIASACIALMNRNIHTRITDCAPAPFQEAAVTALRIPPEYFELLRSDYESKRDFIIKMLAGVGFRIQFKPQGSVFVFAELPENCLLSDVEFIKESIKQAGVVAVPGCGFFHTMPPSDKRAPADLSYQKRYIRFAFCKSDATLAAAAQKIAGLSDARGRLKLF